MVAALTNIINYKNKYYHSVPIAQPGDGLVDTVTRLSC